MSWAQDHARGLGLLIWLICLLAFVVAMILNTLIFLDLAPGGRLNAIDLYYEPGFLALATFGALIIVRWPDQVMGWLFCAIGVFALVSSLAMTYEQFYGAERAPLLNWALVVSNLIGLSHLLMLLAVVPYLFPNGRLLSRRWRPLLALSIVTIVLFSIGGAFSVETLGLDDRQEIANPVYIAGLSDVLDVVRPLVFVVIPLILLGGVLSLVLRFRRSRGVERLQIRWLVWILAVMIALVLVFLLAEIVTPSLINTSDDSWTLLEITFGMTILFGISIGIPAVLGLTILRYRLYSIDRIVHRTIVYGALTLGLGAIYWGGVVLLQQVLAPITPSSNLSVAGSTLTVAALFQPLRRWIQDIVDRRFFRHKYDAATTIEAFSAQLRDAVDLDTLIVDLQGLVEDTMQPASVALWLRPQSHLDRA